MPQLKRKEKKKISLRQINFKGKSIGGCFPQEALFHALPAGRNARGISGGDVIRGSMTLEAALALPLFLFAVSAILSLFLMMQTQYIVGNSLDRAVADIALLRDISPKEAKVAVKAAFYKELTAQKCPFSLIRGGFAGFSWDDTEVSGAVIHASVAYEIKFPVSLFGMKAMKSADTCRIHRWTGRQGQEDGNDGEAWVYVTPTQSVYHQRRDCTHLKLSIKSVSVTALPHLGTPYVPCGHCVKGQALGSVAYVTEEGGCYHCRIDCSGLKRTIYMIKKSQAGGKRACSRCQGR